MCPLLVWEMQSCRRQGAKTPVGKDQGRGVASPSMYGPSLAHSSRDLLSDPRRDQAFSGLQLPHCELCREVVLHKPPVFRPTLSLMPRSLLSASLWVRLPLAMRPHSPIVFHSSHPYLPHVPSLFCPFLLLFLLHLYGHFREISDGNKGKTMHSVHQAPKFLSTF